MDIWAIIPVKSLRQTKSRLTAVLSIEERAKLTQQFIRRILQLLSAETAIARIIVVSRDETVRQLAQPYGALVIAESEKAAMNGAIHTGTHLAALSGADRVLILPSDLPYLGADDIKMVCHTAVARPHHILICPDRHQKGTNGLLLPPHLPFRFQFGPDSFSRHVAEAGRLQFPAHFIRTTGWQFDLDTAEDWQIFTTSQVTG